MVFCSLSLEFTISFIRIQKERKHLSGLSYKNESILFGSSTIFVERGTFLQNLSETLLFYIKEAPDFFYHFAALKNGAMISTLTFGYCLTECLKMYPADKKIAHSLEWKNWLYYCAVF